MEPNDAWYQANGPLRWGRDYHGYPDDDRDYFSVYVPSVRTLSIDLLNHTGERVQFQLFYEQVTPGPVAWDTDGEPYDIEYSGTAGWYNIYTGAGYNNSNPLAPRVTYSW